MNRRLRIIISLLGLSLVLSLAFGVTVGKVGVEPQPPAHFGEAKRLAREIYADHRETFYCGCHYDKHNKIDLKSCGYRIQGDKRRANRIEWEHIMPVSLWGKELPCWKNPICCKGEGHRYYKGRACCRDVDKHFAKMEADLHNLVPEIGELEICRKKL